MWFCDAQLCYINALETQGFCAVVRSSAKGVPVTFNQRVLGSSPSAPTRPVWNARDSGQCEPEAEEPESARTSAASARVPPFAPVI